VVSNTYCVFVLFFFVVSSLCYQFLWIVPLFWMPLRYFLTFLYYLHHWDNYLPDKRINEAIILYIYICLAKKMASLTWNIFRLIYYCLTSIEQYFRYIPESFWSTIRHPVFTTLFFFKRGIIFQKVFVVDSLSRAIRVVFHHKCLNDASA